MWRRVGRFRRSRWTPAKILDQWDDAEQPVGLAAYDFGFGTAFFDYENDGDQDLYWLGAMGGKGEGPNGFKYTGSGRMLRGDGEGAFEDITVEAQLLTIQGVNYRAVDPNDPEFDRIVSGWTVSSTRTGRGWRSVI